MQIYNTLTREKEDFVPLKPNEISMYVCGPTVYNYIHIGNARSIIAFDTIRRYLEYRGFKVKFVSNFTDVDDKMINQAKKDGILVEELADKYIEAYFADTKALNIKPADIYPRATKNIPEIVEFVQDLIDKGYAYNVDGDVYYRARKFKHYGQLSDQNIAELEDGASAHIDDAETKEKEDPIDFALWKRQKSADEISWDAPFGKGRPGWHIECSVMSTKYLGNHFDIHGGGQDLEFPHHENEIAQSEAKTGEKFVNYWMHNGFVTVGQAGEKMSKSLGNFVTVHDLIKEVDPRTLRFFMSMTHYRRPINYQIDALAEAEAILKRMENTLFEVDSRLASADKFAANPEFAQNVSVGFDNFILAMDDDFNVQNGLAALYEIQRLVNQHLTNEVVDDKTLIKFVSEFKRAMLVFGVEFKEQNDNLDDKIADLIEQRNTARQQKDFARSDEIRDQLLADGIQLIDTANGTKWKRIDD